MKVGIIVITYNLSAEIFLLQIAAIKKFCTDDYEIRVFDNSNNLGASEAIRYHATQLNIDYRKTFSSSHNGSDSHSFCANLSYQRVKNEYDYYAYFDHDLIPVKEFSVIKILGDKVIAGLGQGAKKKYFWPGNVMWNGNTIDRELIDFSFSHELGLDTGGGLYKMIEKYGEDNCIFFNESYHQNPNYNRSQYAHYSMIADETFMHFIGASNWINLEDNEERINSLLNIAKEKTGL